MDELPRMTLPTREVLRVLLYAPREDHYGLKIAQEVGLPTGSVYPILARLEKAGWITSKWEDLADAQREGRRRRRHYQLTTAGAERVRSMFPSRAPGIIRRFRPQGSSVLSR